MKNVDVSMHARGRSVFVDDIPMPADGLHAVLFTSPVAKGTITRLDVGKAAAAPGVAVVLTHRDVPGKNQVGHMVHDQPLLAVDQVEYIGQPIAIVVAATRRAAVNASKLVEVEITPQVPVFDPLEAAAQGLVHGQKRVLTNGDTSAAWAACAFTASGRIASGPQEHFYFETQRALAIPVEDGTIKVCASVQSPGAFQHHVAEVLGIPMHKVELEIRRLGGGFGGKESTAVWAVAPALAAKVLNRPVKLVLSRHEDITTTGKRHAYVFDYKIGVDAQGNILAYEVDLYQHAGACADISPAVLGRSFLHASGAYRIPNIRVTAVSCRTNIPPNNAFRGFGVPQGFFAVESALAHVAQVMGAEVTTLKRRNLLVDGDALPYGMQLEKVNLVRCWETLEAKTGMTARFASVAEFNRTHAHQKRGLAVTPVCFGISFAQTALNQASSLVNIYVDGTVSVSTGAVEMGQGVNSKIAAIAARTLGIGAELVRVDTTNTSRIPNASPTSASTGADLNGMATQYACADLYQRLQQFAARRIGHDNPADMTIRDGVVFLKSASTGYRWPQLVADAQWARTDLSCHAFYATPAIYLDREKERGRPFAYYSYGVSLVEVLVDTRRGTYSMESVDVVHDVGESLSPAIDRGQVEGAVVQGMGWATVEQIRYAPDGRVLTGANAYKIPDIKWCPAHLDVTFLHGSANPYAVLNSKAVGEPPFVHGLGAYFALLHALRSVRTDKPAPSLPLTPEKVFMYLHG
jgi:xanthine dehydrogenase large subunit